MNYTEFKDEMKEFPLLSIREIQKHFPHFDNRRLVEWQEKGYIRKLRNQFYHFSDQEVDEAFLYFSANEMYHPSYVSLESALSHYGFIPEGVFQITSCTTLKTQIFDTHLGGFSYRHLKPDLFFGYHLQDWNNHRYAIATPEKTLIDYLYLHTELKGPDDLKSLRWNAIEIIEQISMDKLNSYKNYIDSPTLNKRIHILMDFLNVNAE